MNMNKKTLVDYAGLLPAAHRRPGIDRFLQDSHQHRSVGRDAFTLPTLAFTDDALHGPQSPCRREFAGNGCCTRRS